MVTTGLRTAWHLRITPSQLKTKSCLVLLSLLTVLSLATFHSAHALGGVTLTAPTRSSVSIDGVLQPNEWADGTHLSFNWATPNNSSLVGGGNIWVKTNGTDLLIAVGADGTTNTNTAVDTYNYTLTLLFDNNNTGTIANNDNAKSLGISYSSSGNPTATYRDLHYDSTVGRYVDNTNVLGVAAGTHSPSGSWSWEFAMPLSSSDFILGQNTTGIGMDLVYSEQHYSNQVLVSSGWSYWQEGGYPNGYPTSTDLSADPWATIIWTNLNAPIVDSTPPIIGTPTIKPTSPGPSDTVTVSVNVTDDSSVKNVTLTYTTDSWKSVNKTIVASYNGTTHVATVQIPPLQFGGQVEYYITAFDSANLKAVNNNSGSYFSYNVSNPFFTFLWLFVVLGLAIAVIVYAVFYTRRKHPSTNQQTPTTTTL